MRITSESILLARALLDILEDHCAATDGRSYTSRSYARSRQRAFLRALRGFGAEADDVHTHIYQGDDGRWRVYATRVDAYPLAGQGVVNEPTAAIARNTTHPTSPSHGSHSASRSRHSRRSAPEGV